MYFRIPSYKKVYFKAEERCAAVVSSTLLQPSAVGLSNLSESILLLRIFDVLLWSFTAFLRQSLLFASITITNSEVFVFAGPFAIVEIVRLWNCVLRAEIGFPVSFLAFEFKKSYLFNITFRKPITIISTIYHAISYLISIPMTDSFKF